MGLLDVIEFFGDAYMESRNRRFERKVYNDMLRQGEEERRKRERELERREREREARREREAEERRRRLATLYSDTESAARELSSYKRSTVNPELSSQSLKQQSAMRVSDSAMNDDVQAKIRGQISQDESRETSQLARELSAIDELLSKISSLERVS